jgi:putative holliday junction resolvase
MGENPQPASSSPATQIVLAFDFGLRRIGIAVGDTLTRTAAARPAAAVHAAGPDWDAIEREIQAMRPQLLLVGVPHHADGSASTLAQAARDFGRALQARFGLPLEHVDEWGSSLEAGARLRQGRAQGTRSRRVTRADIDSTAAAIILERWLSGERLPSARAAQESA